MEGRLGYHLMVDGQPLGGAGQRVDSRPVLVYLRAWSGARARVTRVDTRLFEAGTSPLGAPPFP